MKVSELIEALKALPQDLEVQTEGCDCYGDVATVRHVEAQKNGLNFRGQPMPDTAAYVLLERSTDR